MNPIQNCSYDDYIKADNAAKATRLSYDFTIELD